MGADRTAFNQSGGQFVAVHHPDGRSKAAQPPGTELEDVSSLAAGRIAALNKREDQVLDALSRGRSTG
jgi:hypothetical protein